MRTKGAIKLHVQLGSPGWLDCRTIVNDGDTNDVRIARQLTFPLGTIVAMDRRYLDYVLYRWTSENAVQVQIWMH